MKLFLLAGSLCTASSFVAPSLPSFASTALRASKSDAEAHMDVMPKVWDELKKAERDLVVQQQVGDIDESEASKAMAEKLLETALDFVRTKERIEEELAEAAHKTFQHAAEEERVLKEHVLQEDVAEILDVADRYVDERLHMAQETEREKLAEEHEHLEQWAELRLEEEFIKSALKELEGLDKKTIDPWADVEDFDQ